MGNFSTIRSTWVILILSLLFSLLHLNAQDVENDYDIKFNQKIIMRDGVHLAASIFFPAPMKEPLPALFVFTPYSKDGAFPFAQYYAKNNFLFGEPPAVRTNNLSAILLQQRYK